MTVLLYCCMTVWLYRFLDICFHGCMNIYGSMALWLYGCIIVQCRFWHPSVSVICWHAAIAAIDQRPETVTTVNSQAEENIGDIKPSNTSSAKNIFVLPF